MEHCPKMDLSPFDPAEVARYHANQESHGALMRFANHVREVNPGHIWPSLVFSQFGATDDECYFHLDEAVRLGIAHVDAEKAEEPVRLWNEHEATLFRGALYRHIHASATMGFLDAAKQSLARALEFDPGDRLNNVGMAIRLGIISREVTEAAYTLKM